MNKKTIITVLLALIATTGQAQVKCHVEGTLETDARIVGSVLLIIFQIK